jgi:hypothetical protein
MAGNYDIVVEQGATFGLVITWRDSAGALVNLTSYTAFLEVRRGRTTPVGPLILSMTTSNGCIALGGALGTITLALTATQTAALTPGIYEYDLEMRVGSNHRYLLSGHFIVPPRVVR